MPALQRRPLTLALTAALLVCFATTPAVALDTTLPYTFFQNGYSEGATVTGAFSGVDLDGNGLLIHFAGASGGEPIEFLELSDWSMHFSGNSLSPAFDLDLDDLYGFVYQLGTTGIGDDPAFDPTLNTNLIEGIGAIGASHFFTTGLGPNSMIGGFVGGQIVPGSPDYLEEHALDTAETLLLVPEPGAVGMLIAAGLALAATARNRVTAPRQVT
jgi:hypothetical protein